MELPPRPTLFDFHGVSMTKYFTDNWENIQSFKEPHGFPTSWIFSTLGKQTIVLPFLCKKECLSWRSVYLLDLKVVYVARNAKDSAVSYFHFGRMNRVQPEPGDWSYFLQNFMQGKVVFGSWYEHVNTWWDQKQTYSNLHYMFYEDLIEDSGQEISRLCCFLGLSPTAEQKELVQTKVTFDNMKQNKITNFSTVPMMNQSVSPFMRKGRVGDWKNHFTVSQNEQFEEDYKNKMKNSALVFRSEI
ncbi:cytosolic sulfotransferase 2-like isoform X4 [Gambusia affinis]|nr:cytosolic sulfotransferase 2-like isoform X4 [Gambusia affinis]